MIRSMRLGLLAVLFACAAVMSAKACPNPTQMQGFQTCANVAKAEQEGAVVIYSPDPEANTGQLLEWFHQAFPKIATSFIRLQTGALYQKLMTERRARTFQVDVLQLTDMGYVLDFQKRNGYVHYVSPEMAAYKAEYKSQPEGSWTWGSFIMAGLAYNPRLVKPEDAPKSWKDALDPRWAGVVNTKASTSGLQHVAWYEMKQLYGDDYWTRFAALKPRGFDSYVQQYDRMVSGQDTLVHTAQYSAYLLLKAKGAPVAFVVPEEGMATTPGVWGLPSDAPHPEAAKLFLDWLLSVPGQTALETVMSVSSPRADAPPPPGGLPASAFKILAPTDWQAFLATHAAFVKAWDHITGVR